MRKLLLTATTACALTIAPAALPCGGGFGQSLRLSASQKIVIAHDGTTETYVFSPEFCGASNAFGLILPVPATPTAGPSEGDPDLVPQLEELAKPTVVERDPCDMDGGAGGRPHDRSHGTSASPGVQVINQGRVGLLEYSVLRADSTEAFTDWLQANSYPYTVSSLSAFSHYVRAKWQFIAFKIATGGDAPPAGSLLCGKLGPFQVSFPANKPVIPARIAAATADTAEPSSFNWRVFTIAKGQVTGAPRPTAGRPSCSPARSRRNISMRTRQSPSSPRLAAA